MSSASGRPPSPPEDVVAALLWDLPALRASTNPGAGAFVDAMGPPPIDLSPTEEDPAPLERAARAAWLTRSGDHATAAPLLDRLSNEGDIWTRLLGLMLVAWSAGSDDTSAVQRAAEIIRSLDDRQLRARLLNKASLFAYDKGWGDVGEPLLAEAYAASGPGTRLHTTLAWGLFARGVQPNVPAGEVGEDDSLTSLPWITDLALGAAREALDQETEDRIKGSWTWTIRAGRSPLDSVLAADNQATWSGAHWIRPSIRKQLGAQLISGGASTPEQWAYAVAMWTLGGGKVAPAFELAEPHLDVSGVDRIVEALVREAGPNAQKSLREAAVATWATMSDAVAETMFERVPITPVPHPALAEPQRVWARLAWRAPQAWADHYLRLAPELQRSLVTEIPPEAVSQMPRKVIESVLTAALGEIDGGDGTGWPFYVAATLADRLEDRATFDRIVEGDPPIDALIMIAEAYQEHDLDGLLAEGESRLIEIVERSNREAHEGTVGFGGRSPRLELGHIGALRNLDTPSCVNLLMQTALDADLPGEFQSEARQALAQLHIADKLRPADLEALHHASDVLGRFPSHGDVTSRLLEVFRLQALAPELSPEERVALVSCCRDPDPRVREVAMYACRITLSADRADQALVWGMVAGLFDPVETVVRVAVSGVGENLLADTPAAAQVATDRLPRIYRTGAELTRESVVTTSRRLYDLSDLSASSDLVALAAQDKSWRVRRAAIDPRIEAGI